jgi:hypothetical protein
MIEIKSETQQMLDNANASIISELRRRIAELEKEVKGYQVALSMPTNNEAHNLEQQAKGCTDGAKACSISFGEGVVIGETELDGYAKDLLRQAKALKEKVK